MKEFKKEVNMENREEMVRFLHNHFRYSTARSWNGMSSYANNMKIYNLGLPSKTKSKLYDMLDIEDVTYRISDLIRDFAINHDYEWQAGWNGRSSGYLVLYTGGRKKLEYKSRCVKCGQLSYKNIAETGNCKCGHCGNETCVDLVNSIYQSYVNWQSVDQDEDFEDWDMDELVKRVRIVMDFDQLCDDIVSEAVYMANECEIEEETYYVAQTRKVLTEHKTA